MDEIDFLTINDIHVIHIDQTLRYGGDPGVRDVGLLESAIAQPRSAFGGQTLHAFPFEMAEPRSGSRKTSELRTCFISCKTTRSSMATNAQGLWLR